MTLKTILLEYFRRVRGRLPNRLIGRPSGFEDADGADVSGAAKGGGGG
jgi:hypothetical protein